MQLSALNFETPLQYFIWIWGKDWFTILKQKGAKWIIRCLQISTLSSAKEWEQKKISLVGASRKRMVNYEDGDTFVRRQKLLLLNFEDWIGIQVILQDNFVISEAALDSGDQTLQSSLGLSPWGQCDPSDGGGIGQSTQCQRGGDRFV